MTASIWLWFIPLYVIGGIVLLFGLLALLARIKGGKLVRPFFALLAKVPFFKRLMTKASKAALERQNPELASAMEKLERSGATRDPTRAQAALSRLSPAERRAYLAAVQEQGAVPEPQNRAERRRLQKLKAGSQPQQQFRRR